MGYWRENLMSVSYKKLSKMLIDKEMKKKQLCEFTGISPSTISKMAKDEAAFTEIVVWICDKLNCTFDDIVEIVSDGEISK